MGINKKDWGSQAWIEGGAGSFTTLSGATEEYSAAVDLVTNGYEGSHVMVEGDFDVSPTDDIKIKVYGSLDGTNWDDTPIHEFTLDKDTDPNQVSFVVHDVAHFRLGFQQTGSTDSHDVRASHKPWRWNAA